MSEDKWRVKLGAWLHDPAEKAVILLRGRSHERYVIDEIKRICFPNGLEPRLIDLIKMADHWAAGADRPTMPIPRESAHPEWTRVRFWKFGEAELIHPLGGDRYDLGSVYKDTLPKLEELSLEVYLDVIAPKRNGSRQTVKSAEEAFLNLWRLLPELDSLNLGHLWNLLPADTRVPTHNIWDHLSLTSALAGAMAEDPEGNVALFACSIGPVQDFIQKARSSSDLWAGSHLLSYLAWTCMEVLCEDFGPDAIIYPRLFGVPIVDFWLEGKGVDFSKLEKPPAWKESASDSNPLFIAALPNRFVALIPACAIGELPRKIEEKVRESALALALRAAKKVFGCKSLPQVMVGQIKEQLREFPEVHWAFVSFRPLIEWDENGVLLERREKELEKALGIFFPAQSDTTCPGFLGTKRWNVLRRSFTGKQDLVVYRPNPGVLYPALYELLERVQAAAKATRPFSQFQQEGFRCTLCGDLEWLCEKREDLWLTPGKRIRTQWRMVEASNPSWAKKGEHLCSLCTLKRLWPDLFAEIVGEKLNIKIDRYMVSTHTLALANDLKDIIADPKGLKAISEKFGSKIMEAPVAAMPLKLHRMFKNANMGALGEILRRLPAYLDRLRQEEDSDDPYVADRAQREREELEKELERLIGNRPEAYYAILMMDGDHMGAWISGTTVHQLKYKDLFHSKTIEGLEKLAAEMPQLKEYLDSQRSPSPAYHGSISNALNGFALHVVPYVLEELYMGKTIYAGGDDVLGLMSVDECIEAALTLRCAFSGIVPGSAREAVWAILGWLQEQKKVLKGQIGRGFVLVRDKLLPVMGRYATASIGLAIAHHKTPLQLVVREARNAEMMAKKSGRNSLGITLIKRAGGTIHLVLPFGFGGSNGGEADGATVGNTPVGALLWLKDMLGRKGMSRRAAYQIQQWLRPLRGFTGDELALKRLLSSNLAWQLRRQWSGPDAPDEEIRELSESVAQVALGVCKNSGHEQDPASLLDNMFSVAEFLAREGRARTSRRSKTSDTEEVPNAVAQD